MQPNGVQGSFIHYKRELSSHLCLQNIINLNNKAQMLQWFKLLSEENKHLENTASVINMNNMLPVVNCAWFFPYLFLADLHCLKTIHALLTSKCTWHLKQTIVYVHQYQEINVGEPISLRNPSSKINSPFTIISSCQIREPVPKAWLVSLWR